MTFGAFWIITFMMSFVTLLIGAKLHDGEVTIGVFLVALLLSLMPIINIIIFICGIGMIILALSKKEFFDKKLF